jgi:plasmid stabilization system protein ParE
MRLVLHRRVRSDVDEIMDYYERAEHPELAQDWGPAAGLVERKALLFTALDCKTLRAASF